MSTLDMVLDKGNVEGGEGMQLNKVEEVVDRYKDDANTLTRILETFTPKVVLVPVDLPLLRGLDSERHADTSSNGDDRLLQAIRSGAMAYLGKNASTDELAGIIRGVREGVFSTNGEMPNRAKVASQILRQLQGLTSVDKAESHTTPLTRRESQALRYVAEGYSNKQIARALYVSEQTVKNHVSSVQHKLGASNRTHAVVLAMRQGCIDLGEPVSVPEA